MTDSGPSLVEFKLAIESFSVDGSKHEIDRLKNSIRHLERTNQELRDIIKNGPDDSDVKMLMDVIGENKNVIEMQNCRIDLLEQHIKDIQGIKRPSLEEGLSDAGENSSRHQGERKNGVII